MPAKKASKPRIFVSIASYRDPDCQWTVKDLFEKAAHPERIFVGICWQYVKGEDDFCFEVPYPRPKQVRVHEIDARQGKGVCWARGLVQKLWEGEEFTLQVDSHMRFEPGWDETLLDMWKACGRKKAILTCYPPGYTPPDTLQRDWVFGMAAKHFDAHGILLMHGRPGFSTNKLPDKPIPGAFASACMLFGPSSINKDVPYDPNLYFFGEEISLAVRLWTHGYDLYHPNRLVIFHDWDRSKRKTHFDDHSDWDKRNDRSFARVRHMLGTEITHDPELTKDLDIYGLGKARTLAEYEAYSGVDFSTKTISEKALAGVYEPYMPEKTNKKIAIKKSNGAAPRIFVNIPSYRDRECQWTVKDLFEKAAHPDRIHVGICWQFDEKTDQDCFEIITRPDQVRVYPVDWRESEGPCWARHQAQQLWEGEEYSLQIDAHTRFTPGWDERLIEEISACVSEKPVLSCDPASYTPPNALQPSPRPSIRLTQPFLADGNIRGWGEVLDRVPQTPLRGAFIASRFVFASSNILNEVPYDPCLYIDQEEITYAARLYTHGWDVFSARQQMLYHYYNPDVAHSVRPLHWQDLKTADENKLIFLRDRGIKRFNHLTGHRLSNIPEVIKDIATYGMGKARTLKQFEDYAGIDFKRKQVSEKAVSGQFIADLKKYCDRTITPPALPAASQAPRHAPMHFGDESALLTAPASASLLIKTQGAHQPKKVFESEQAIIFDDFLPEDVYQNVWRYALTTDYEYINTKGKISRAWHLQDGFPLRSSLNAFYYAPSQKKPENTNYVYPTNTELDTFIDHVLGLQPKVNQLTGKEDQGWGHLTATCWVYPPGTGLALHDDGSGVYSGAYVYFLNPLWRMHWGGLLIMMDKECNRRVHEHRGKHDQMEFYKLKWFNANQIDDLIMEHGFGKCILPKRNRIVFIHNEAYHTVTRVNEQAGDNARMSIAGFFNLKKATGSDGNY